MPDRGAQALDRLGRVVGLIESAPTPLDDAGLAKALRLAIRLWVMLFTRETGISCTDALPPMAEAPAAFASCPDRRRDPVAFQAWHRTQAGLFLRYAPMAEHLLGPDSQPGERAADCLIVDALRLLDDHAAGLGRDATRHGTILPPRPPFARLVQRLPQPRSQGSSDVNLGAVAVGLAIESGMRHVLDVAPANRLSMWRLFRALAHEAEAVRLAVDLPLLVAIYNWAARHRSAGQRGHGWLNYWAADLLHPLFVPPPPLGFGLEASPEVLARLRRASTDRHV